MSASSISPPSTPAEPHTPPSASPAVRLTLPTPPSFSRRQRSHSVAPDSPQRSRKLDSGDSVSSSSGSSDDSGAIAADDSLGMDNGEWKKSHGRSVSFHIPGMVSPVSPTKINSSNNGPKGSDDPAPSPGLYRIPQRTPDYVPSPTFSNGNPTPAETGEKKRRAPPPRPLSLAPSSQRYIPPGLGSAVSPFARVSQSASAGIGSQGPTSGAPASRWSTAAAARGLSIAPSLARQRHSTSAASGPNANGSIWSANLTSLGASSGWISPALASARSTGTATRTRGLTAAVVKDGKEIIMETLPTPGLGPMGMRSPPVREEESEEMEMLKDESPAMLSPKAVSPAFSSARSDTKKPREIILCRYYHTPDLTCTSRPCRFVHDLATIGVVDGSISDYNMKSPTTANLPASALVSPRLLANGSPDYTSGTFAAFQAEAQRKRLSIVDADEKGIVPGEKVVVASGNGQEVEGLVFLMSGGGKGPAGRGKAKYKTVPCKDFAEGHCSYGDYCSFIHVEKPAEAETAPTQPPNSATPHHLKPTFPSSKADCRKSFDPSALKGSVDAWRKVPATVKQPLVAVIPDALDRNRQGLSAFAAPFLDKPVNVDEKGRLVPATPGLPPAQKAVDAISRKSDDSSQPLADIAQPPLSAKELNLTVRTPFQRGPAPALALARPKSSELGPRKKKAWSKGPPPMLKKVTINTDPTVHAPSTLGVPASPATSLFGTESDPATPWDPAVRASKLAEAADKGGEDRNPEYPLTATYAQPAPDYPYASAYSHSHAPMSHPFNSPTYPWGMPMSPVAPSGGDQGDDALPQISGGLGVMWTPAGWAVQDAAMKMALFQAEANRMGVMDGKTGGFKPKTYYRTRKCKFFADGNCPHGDSCTYIHELSSTSDAQSKIGRSKPSSAPRQRKNAQFQTQPCKFFNSAAGCLNGTNCAFLHTLVVPDSVPLVEKPRPWRTRPCRHYQVGKCHLGDACHFAHVFEGAHEDGLKQKQGQGQGRRYSQEPLTEETLARAMEGRGSVRSEKGEEDDESDDDDVEIVTEDTSSTSRPHSVRA